MREILMSIRPQWCEKIFNGSKKIEVRKSRPYIHTPFKVYVYQTKIRFKVRDWQENFQSMVFTPNGGVEEGNGKVIGWFVCEGIMRPNDSLRRIAEQSLLTEQELFEYSNGKTLFGWRITAPKLFDKPKDISEFGWYETKYHFINRGIETIIEEYKKFRPLTRPPQSWCYVAGGDHE